MEQFTLTPHDASRMRNAMLFGYVSELLHATDRAKLSIASAYRYLAYPIRLGQISIAFCHRTGAPRAYLAYALCSPQTADNLYHGRDVGSLALSEWNEGRVCWITDVVAPYSDSMRAIRFLKHHTPIFVGGARYTRIQRNEKKYVIRKGKLNTHVTSDLSARSGE